jgi:hypothetical protein
MGAVVMAAAMRKERRTVEAFERAGATSPERAQAPNEIGVEMHGLGWRRVIDQAIVREAAPGRYYLDVPSWIATRRMRTRRVLILLVVVVALAAWYYGPWHAVSAR